jgi:hypothetical protein
MSFLLVSSRYKRRGAAIIGVLFFILITSILLMGVGLYAVSHQTRAMADAQYAAAIDAAEAGINYELRSLSSGANAHVSNSPGTGTFGTAPWQSSFSVICTQADGTAITDPANPPSTILIQSTGTMGNIVRTIRIRARKGSGQYNYAVYSKNNSVINGNQTIVGSVGTSGTITVNGANGITDRVIGLHGPSARAIINPPGSFQTEQRPDITWPTVAEVAATMFPYGGLTWLQTNNDNALATAHVNNGQLNGQNYNNKDVSPAIVNNAITANGSGTITLRGKAGGANYYLNNMTLNGSWLVNFDNSAGPINIWCVGKNGGSGSFTINGGNSSVSMSQDPSKAVRVYVADKCSLILNGNGDGKFGVYAINSSPTGGSVTLNGNNNLYGSVIANNYTFNGTNNIYYTEGYFTVGPSNWTFDGDWVEVNPR